MGANAFTARAVSFLCVCPPAPWVLLLPPLAEHTDLAVAANVVDRVAVPADGLKPSVRSASRDDTIVWYDNLGTN